MSPPEADALDNAQGAGVGAAHGDRCTECGQVTTQWHLAGCSTEPMGHTENRFADASPSIAHSVARSHG